MDKKEERGGEKRIDPYLVIKKKGGREKDWSLPSYQGEGGGEKDWSLPSSQGGGGRRGLIPT